MSQYPPPPGQYPSPGQYPGQYPPPGQYPAPGYPQAGYPQPGYVQPVAPPPKRSYKALWITLSIVAVLCCGGSIVGGYALFKGVTSAVAPVRAAATEYLDAIEARDYPRAYAKLCSSVKAQVSLEDVEAAAPTLDSYKITNTSVSNTNGVHTGSVTVELTADGATRTRVLALVKEGGDWYVCDE